MKPFKKLFCSHNYEIINQFKMLSEFDIVADNGYTPKTNQSIKRQIITDFKCGNCNKLKRKKVITY